LPKHLLVAILGYRMQVDQSGDLDPRTRQFLEQIDSGDDRTSVVAKVVAFDRK
jgi:hypothetical protein